MEFFCLVALVFKQIVAEFLKIFACVHLSRDTQRGFTNRKSLFNLTEVFCRNTSIVFIFVEINYSNNLLRFNQHM